MSDHLAGEPLYPGPYPTAPYAPVQPGPYAQPYPAAAYPPASYAPAPYPPSAYPPSAYPPAAYPSRYQPLPYPLAPYPPVGYTQPHSTHPPQSERRWLTGLAALLVAVGLLAAGVAATDSNSAAIAGSGSTRELAPGNPGIGNPAGPGSSTAPTTPSGPATPSSPSPPGATTPGSATPTARQKVGIVTVVSVLSFQSAEAAGTGMIISSNGTILTNNHVINGATSITVTDQTSGRSYRADVVGTAPTQDVAVLKLRAASGLQTATLATTTAGVRIGDAVVGVGNAGGTGHLTAATGTVTALDQSITASDESGQESERLHGLIQINAPIISGDSGGPLYNAAGKIIGIDTAASASREATKLAYAIPIDNARSVVKQIESGVQTATIHIGLPGFLGITSRAATGGVAVQDVVANGPADTAGITPGSVITSVDGKTVTTPTGLRAILTAKDPGDRVSVSWTATDGTRQTKSVTLTTGPAD